MKRLFLIIFTVGFTLSAWAEAPKSVGDIAPEKRAEIDKLLQLTGMEKLLTQVMSQMIAQLKAGMPSAPSTFWDKFTAKIDTRELVQMIIPLYDKYYSVEDLRAVNAFYSSPAGQKILSTTPQLMQESMRVGQKWGEEIGRRAAKEAAEETHAVPKSS